MANDNNNVDIQISAKVRLEELVTLEQGFQRSIARAQELGQTGTAEYAKLEQSLVAVRSRIDEVTRAEEAAAAAARELADAQDQAAKAVEQMQRAGDASDLGKETDALNQAMRELVENATQAERAQAAFNASLEGASPEALDKIHEELTAWIDKAEEAGQEAGVLRDNLHSVEDAMSAQVAAADNAAAATESAGGSMLDTAASAGTVTSATIDAAKAAKELRGESESVGSVVREGAHLMHGMEMATGGAALSMRGLASATSAASSAMMRNPWLIVAAALAAVAAAAYEAHKKHQEAAEKMAKEQEDVAESAKKTEATFESLASSKLTFKDQIEAGEALARVWDADTAAAEKLSAAQDKLQDANMAAELSRLKLERTKALNAAGPDKQKQAEVNLDYDRREADTRDRYAVARVDRKATETADARDANVIRYQAVADEIDRLGQALYGIEQASEKARDRLRAAGIDDDSKRVEGGQVDSFEAAKKQLQDQLDAAKAQVKGGAYVDRSNPDVLRSHKDGSAVGSSPAYYERLLALVGQYEAAQKAEDEQGQKYTDTVKGLNAELDRLRANQIDLNAAAQAAQVAQTTARTDRSATAAQFEGKRAEQDRANQTVQLKDQLEAAKARIDQIENANAKITATNPYDKPGAEEGNNATKKAAYRADDRIANEKALAEAKQAVLDIEEKIRALQGESTEATRQETAQQKERAKIEAEGNVRQIDAAKEAAAWEQEKARITLDSLGAKKPGASSLFQDPKKTDEFLSGKGDKPSMTASPSTDFSGRYNTPIPPEQKAAFDQWLQSMSKSKGRDIRSDLKDYDLAGFFLSGGAAAENGHFSDEFKKPNHPTFSAESRYNGADGYRGGQWQGDTFTPSQTNLQFYPPDAMRNYFSRAEPNAQLTMGGPGDGGSGQLDTAVTQSGAAVQKGTEAIAKALQEHGKENGAALKSAADAIVAQSAEIRVLQQQLSQIKSQVANSPSR